MVKAVEIYEGFFSCSAEYECTRYATSGKARLQFHENRRLQETLQS